LRDGAKSIRVDKEGDIVVGVHVNEARRHKFARCINAVFGFSVKELTDGGDAITDDANIGEEGWTPRPVQNASRSR